MIKSEILFAVDLFRFTKTTTTKLTSKTKSLFLVFLCFASISVLSLKINAQIIKTDAVPQILLLQNPIEQNFKSDEVYNYNLTALAGQFVEINADQFGVDIRLMAIAPNGKTILTVNAPTFWFGRENISFIASETGVYSIKIYAARTGNFSGHYKIELKNLRLAQPIDFEQVDATRLLSEATILLEALKNVSIDLPVAKQKLETALAVFKKSDDLRSVAVSLLLIGRCDARKGLRDDALARFNDSLKVWRQMKDEAGEAVLLNDLGGFYLSMQQGKLGLQHLEQSLSLRRANLDRLGEAVILTTLCRFYNDNGEMQLGLENCRKSLSIRQDGDPASDIYTYNFLGNIYSNIGDWTQSAKAFESAISKFDKAGANFPRISQAGVINNLGGVYVELKQCDTALDYSFRALKIIEESSNLPTSKETTLINIGQSYQCLGDNLKAVDYLQQALMIFEKYNENEASETLNALGSSFTELNQNDKAQELFNRALTLNRVNADRYALIDTLYNSARFEQKLGESETAKNNIKEAIDVAEILRANLINKNLRTQFTTKRLQKFYELYIEILMSLDKQNPEKGYASIALQANESSRARILLELVAETGFDLRRDADPKLLKREKDLLESISTKDEKRLKSSANSSERTAIESQITRLNNDYDDLQDEIRRTNPRYESLHEPKILNLEEIQSKILDKDTALLEYSLGEKRSFIWLVKRNSIKTFEIESRQKINSSASLFYSTLNGTQHFKDAKQRDIALNLTNLVLSDSVRKELRDVKRILVVTDGALQYVPFAVLLNPKPQGKNPNSATQNDYIIQTKEVTVLPSISTLSALREGSSISSQNRKMLAVMADPIFDVTDERVLRIGKVLASKPEGESGKVSANINVSKQLPTNDLTEALRDFGANGLSRLPFSGREAAAIASDAPNDSMLAVGFKANRASVLRGDLNNYKILHFATHGLLNAENPNLSGLVLSLIDEDGKSQNGFLRTQDIFTLKLHADLVVLSACQSGLGKEIAGEGLVGLTRAFMYAGSPRVVASLWKVDDAATAELMKRFYRAMLIDKQTPSAALRTAQIEISQIPRWKNPTYWAGFVLQGDFR